MVNLRETLMDIQVIRAHTTAEIDLASQCHGHWFVEAGRIPPDPAGLYLNAYTGRSFYYLALAENEAVGLVLIMERTPFQTVTQFELNAAYRGCDFSEKACAESTALCWRANWGLTVLPHLYRA